jgi:hypothetical protein
MSAICSDASFLFPDLELQLFIQLNKNAGFAMLKRSQLFAGQFYQIVEYALNCFGEFRATFTSIRHASVMRASCQLFAPFEKRDLRARSTQRFSAIKAFNLR